MSDLGTCVGFGPTQLPVGPNPNPNPANLSSASGVDVVHATRQVCCPAEKTAGKKTTRLKKMCTFMQTRDMYLHFTRSNVGLTAIHTILVAG